MVVYNALVLSGGGVKGLAMMGALYHYELTKDINCLNTFVGTSVGGILCVLLAAGYRPSELINMVIEESIDVSKMISIGPRYTIPKVKELLVKRLEVDPTNMTIKEFKDLTKKTIRLISTCLNTPGGHMIVLGEGETENCPLLLAVEATSSIPLLFSPVTYQKHILIDGGFICNFPIQCLDLDENKTLAMNFESNPNKIECTGTSNNLFTSLIQVIFSNFNALDTDTMKTIVRKHPDTLTYVNLTCDMSPLNSNMTKAQKFNTIKSGYFQASTQLHGRIVHTRRKSSPL